MYSVLQFFQNQRKPYSKKIHQQIIWLWNSNESNIKQIVNDILTQRKQEINITLPVEIEINKSAICDTQERMYMTISQKSTKFIIARSFRTENSRNRN